MSVLAHDGETVDGLIWRTAGLGAASLGAVFGANPRLCERVTLDAGERVFLPTAATETAAQNSIIKRTNLWD